MGHGLNEKHESEDEAGGEENTAQETFFSSSAMTSIPWLVIGKAATFFVQIAILTALARGLVGSDEDRGNLGLFQVCYNTAGFLLVLCSLGLNTSVLRFVPELVKDGNLTGLKNLLRKTPIVQAVSIAVVAGLCALLFPLVRGWLPNNLVEAFDSYFFLTFGLTAVFVLREFLNNTLTAVYKARTVALASLAQGMLLLVGLSYFWKFDELTVAIALAVHIGASLAISIFRTGSVLRYFKGREPTPTIAGIGRRRVLALSLPVMFNALLNQFMMLYSEVFFLAVLVAEPLNMTLVEDYNTGYQLPFLLLTFLPMAVYTLFVTAFSEAYSRDPGCLGRLVSSYYQILILVALPIGCFGAFFGYEAVPILFGDAFVDAGYVASAFFVIHMLPLISVPLSMAITAKELVGKVVWLQVMRVLFNVVIDFFLIYYFHLVGAICAVVVTFLVTTPITLVVVRRHLGGLFFPGSFFARVAIPCAVLAGLFRLVVPTLNGSRLWLVVLPIAYLVVLAILLKALRLIRASDTAHFKEVGLGKLNRVLDYFTAKS